MPSLDALVCTEPGSLRIERREAVRRAPDHALVRPRRIGICGTDFHIFEGKHPFLAYPRVMGHEIACEVVEAPAGSGLRPGEICVINPYITCGTCIACRNGKPNCCATISVLGVHRDGGMAGLLSLPAGNLLPGDDLSVDQCASVEFLAIGAHAVRRGGVGPNDRALVVGAGPIGIGTALFARLAGAAVTLVDIDQQRLERAATIAGATCPPAGIPMTEAVAEATNAEGFDVVFDATGNRASIEAGFAHVAQGGRYVLVSVVKEAITFSDPDFHRREMSLLGSRNATELDFRRVMSVMRAGDVAMDALITHRTTLTEAVKDFPRWARDKTGLIKALITNE
ncbi:MAG: dehydrogenase [Alphaproteobacteria bacterium HGW-Alphaproteobacteria-6]|nr:MAG: dehydrogenase [Alphaproteobacteria bacterium HGW-Alphaproteobacteria-6]